MDKRFYQYSDKPIITLDYVPITNSRSDVISTCIPSGF